MAVYNEIKDYLKRVPNHPDSNKEGFQPDIFIIIDSANQM